MSKGLAQFGVQAQTVLREAATDHENVRICPECGHPVANSLGTQEVAHAEIVEGADPSAVGHTLLIHGWECDRHAGYSVVMPTRVGENDADRVLRPGWVSVRVRMADGFVRWVATPGAELGDALEGDR